MPAPSTEDEFARLAALHDLRILDSQAESAYDDLVHLAAYICKTPIALVSLVDEHRQWFKARVGIDASETPKDISFCAHAIQDPTHVMEVPDATKDLRFSNNPFVVADPNIRFYAGAPLVTEDGHALGTICVVDHVPRHLSEEQISMLQRLSRQVVAQLQLHARVIELNETTTRCERVANRLRESDERFRLFMDNSPMLAFIKDSDWKYVFANKSILKRFALSEEQVLGKTDYDLWPESAPDIRAHDEMLIGGTETMQFEEKTVMPDGRTRTWLSYKFPFQEADGDRYLAGVALDITEQKFYESQMHEYQSRLEEAVKQMEVLALTDALTGLRNKGSFEARMDEEIARARRYHLPLSLLMIDIDHFKKINDDFGHPVGDETLKAVADLLASNARPSDFVARYGGEEFSIILPNTDAQGACFLAERLRDSVQEFSWPNRPLTISVGAASLEPAESARSLVIRADRALYDAKNAGRNRVSVAGKPA
ncbi:MAG TPA: diguanylate cyclase [Abditibacteriaceae bacterium]|jgi:diguanylate cyclase (GGDEF)-like protein/PAS domain S-box-containing protein